MLAIAWFVRSTIWSPPRAAVAVSAATLETRRALSAICFAVASS